MTAFSPSNVPIELQQAALAEAVSGLVIHHPEWSASTTFTRSQKFSAALVLVLIAGGVSLLGVRQAGSVMVSLLAVGYLSIMIQRSLITTQGLEGGVVETITNDQARAIPSDELPKYTILVPAFDEPEVMSQLVKGLGSLEYPPEKLEIMLLLEADDERTIAAATKLKLEPPFYVVLVPPAEPRTKPKACNYGLQFASGEFVTIYDVEDRPDPLQLRCAVAVFAKADKEIICLQARLQYFNEYQNLLTRWFAIEYLAWFAVLLPGLMARGLPIPLGGTSNHFQTKILKELGAWDPYNVTEDADLGIRISMAGYRTEILDSVTWEEATSDWINWIRQRSRWYKGYLQTWLVHMRSPRTTWRALGPRGFLSFTLLIGGTPIQAALNFVIGTISVLLFVALPDWVRAIFSPMIWLAATASFVAGNAMAYFLNLLALRSVEKPKLVMAAAIYPFYWVLMAIAGVKAVWQLITRPSYWEKTAHGFDPNHVD